MPAFGSITSSYLKHYQKDEYLKFADFAGVFRTIFKNYEYLAVVKNDEKQEGTVVNTPAAGITRRAGKSKIVDESCEISEIRVDINETR